MKISNFTLTSCSEGKIIYFSLIMPKITYILCEIIFVSPLKSLLVMVAAILKTVRVLGSSAETKPYNPKAGFLRPCYFVLR